VSLFDSDKEGNEGRSPLRQGLGSWSEGRSPHGRQFRESPDSAGVHFLEFCRTFGMGGMGGNSEFQEGQFGGNDDVHGGLGGDS
jgi:hypothetical protein